MAFYPNRCLSEIEWKLKKTVIDSLRGLIDKVNIEAEPVSMLQRTN